MTSIAQGRGTSVVNAVYSPLDRHMSHPLASMGVTNAQRRKAPMCLTHIRKEQRGQFSPGVRVCSSVMPCSRAEIQLSFNPTQWDNHQNQKKPKQNPSITWYVAESCVKSPNKQADGRGMGSRQVSKHQHAHALNGVGAAAFWQCSVRKISTSAVLLWRIKSPQSLGLSK